MKEYKDTKLYSFFRPIITLLIKLIYRPIIINKHLIPTNKRVILAGNHTSVMDSFLLISTTKRHIHFLAKKEIFSGFTGLIINRMGLIPVDRKAKDKKDVLINAKKYLENGKIVGIFPEGTTEKDSFPNLLPFKKGAVNLSFETNTYIIPFKIIGKYKIFGKRVKIVFNEPFIATKNTNESNKLLFDIINDMKE